MPRARKRTDPTTFAGRRIEARDAKVIADERGAKVPHVKGDQKDLARCDRCLKEVRAYARITPQDLPDSGFCRACYDLLIQSWARLAVRAGQLDRRYSSIYGLTLEEYGSLFVAQAGACAICKRHEDLPGAGLLVVDHDHATGKVRGLLCSKCNAAIGLLGDSVRNLASAILYLSL